MRRRNHLNATPQDLSNKKIFFSRGFDLAMFNCTIYDFNIIKYFKT